MMANESRKRWPALDAARGLALVAMFAFHIGWDLTYFGITPQTLTDSPVFHGFGHAIAGAFVLIAGIGLTLAARGGLVTGLALQRIGRIALAAAAVSLATWYLFPDAWIFFGILHLIALASLLSLPLLGAPAWAVILLGTIALVLPLIVSEPALDAPAFQWLGLGTHAPNTNDWRPLLPWAGVMFAGLLAGRVIAARGLPGALDTWQPRGFFGRLLILGGRHTLPLYLVHQPIFLAIIFVVATLSGAGPKPADIMSGQSNFMTACEKQCVQTGGEAGLCTRACGCIAEEATAQGMGQAVARNQLSKDEQVRFNEVTKACLRRLVPQPP